MSQQAVFRIAERRSPRTTMQRWAAKVTLPASMPDEGCWEWSGYREHGYGRFWPGGRRHPGVHDIAAHRYSYERFVGPIQPEMTLDHLCRNPGCVNPNHLEAVTIGENLRRSPDQLSTVNTRKTHCLNGHEFTDENTYLYVNAKSHSRGARHCRTCRREANRRRVQGRGTQ